MHKKLLITIDGPAGAGKTTVSRALATRLGYRYIDTGALYRGVALAAKIQGVDANSDSDLRVLCRKLKLEIVQQEDRLGLKINGEDVTDRIRTPEVTMLASAISARSVVREYLLNLQRNLGSEKAAIFEGRDMGTVVFPEADVKFFLDASPRTRAIRRYDELKSENCQSLDQVEQDIQRRDQNDRTREVAPLKAASDAIIIDSTDLGVVEVVQLMVSHIEKIKN
jgi:cytidylate kinase